MQTFRILFENVEGQTVQADIIDTRSAGNDTTVIPLVGSGVPVRLQSIDNDEDKFSPIRAKQCIIEFLSTDQWNLNTFADGQDNRFRVELYVAGAPKFKGFLVLSELEEDFMCVPNVVSLTATDNLGLLKDIPYTDITGANPKGRHTILTYLSNCLLKTNLELTINLEWNLRETRKTAQPFWYNIYLDAKTWEDEIGTCIDCYTLLERLLGEHAFLTQHDGEWWIVRVDEMYNTQRTVYHVPYDLSTIAFTNSTYDKTIVKTGSIFWINRTAYVGLERPYKEVKETYNFEYQKEIVENQGFERGAEIILISSPPNNHLYYIDDWTVKRNFPALGTPTTPAFIRRIIVDGIETDRYAFLDINNLSGSNTDYIESKPVPMSIKDKFTFSVDFSYNQISGGTGSITDIKAVIYVKAGNTFYTLDKNGVWRLNTWQNISATWDNPTIDERDWQTLTVNAQPLPITGDVYICLLKSGTLTDRETRYSNVRLDYVPYINSSYRKYTGQYWKVSQVGEYRAKRDQQVYISDSPKLLFKGSMTYLDAGIHKQTNRWIDWTDAQQVITNTYKHFGDIQASDVWRQYRRVMRIFDGDLKGVNNTELPDLIHTYTLADQSPHTDNRKFICLHYDMDVKRCEWNGHFVEIYKSDDTNIYTETKEFKYSEDRE